MHEVSILSAAMNAVQKSAAQNAITQIEEMTLIIGKLRFAEPSLLNRGFQILKKGSIFENSVLRIEERSPQIRCRSCGVISMQEDPLEMHCPHCGKKDYDLLQGNELLVESFRGW